MKNVLVSLGVLVALFWPPLASAQEGLGYSNGGISRGNQLRKPEYSTSGTSAGAQAFFVNGTLGADTNTCVASGAGACATLQGVVGKFPKQLRNLITVDVAAGNYNGFTLSGFVTDVGYQTTANGILFRGTFANSTLATGTATGTASAGSAGSGATFGTLTDGTQTWTVNDLQGRFIVITAGTGVGTTRVISSNTGTVITVVGTWTAPTGTSVYAIQDASTIINSIGSVLLPSTPTTSTSASIGSVLIADNQINYRAGALTFQGFSFTAPRAVTILDTSSVTFLNDQMNNSSLPITVSGPGSAFGSLSGASVNVTGSYVKGGLAAGVNTTGGSSGVTSTNSLFNNVSYAILAANGGAGVVFSASEAIGIDDVGLTVGGQKLTVTGSRFTCNGVNRAAFSNAADSTGPFNQQQTVPLITIATSDVGTTCGNAVRSMGVGSNIFVDTLSGTTVSVAMESVRGGRIEYTASTTVTGSVDLSLDGQAVTGLLADVATATCIASPSTGSRICKQ